MPAINAALQQTFKAVMAIAHDGIRFILTAIIAHDGNLFLIRMGEELAGRLFHIMPGCIARVFCRLLAVQRAAAEIRFVAVVGYFHIVDVHFFQYAANGLLLSGPLSGAPTILNGRPQARIVGVDKRLVLVDQLPQRKGTNAFILFLDNIRAVVAQGIHHVPRLQPG